MTSQQQQQQLQQEHHQLLTSDQQSCLSASQLAIVHTALNNIRAATQNRAAATLHLCITLEHAVCILQQTGVFTIRTTAVTRLMDWIQQTYQADRSSILDSWGGLRPLLASVKDRQFWTKHAFSIGSIGQLHVIASCLSIIREAKQTEDEQQRFFLLVLEASLSVRATKAFIHNALTVHTAANTTDSLLQPSQTIIPSISCASKTAAKHEKYIPCDKQDCSPTVVSRKMKLEERSLSTTSSKLNVASTTQPKESPTKRIKHSPSISAAQSISFPLSQSPLPPPPISLFELQKTHFSIANLTWSFYFKEPLTHMLPFHPFIDAALSSEDPIVLIDPCPMDKEAMASAFEGKHDPTKYNESYRMNFGCGNNNGHPTSRSKNMQSHLSVNGLWSPLPSEQTLMQHIENDWLLASEHCGQRLLVPLSMRAREYSKDVSEHGDQRSFFPTFSEQINEWEDKRSKNSDQSISEPIKEPNSKKEKKQKSNASQTAEQKMQAWELALRQEFYTHRSSQCSSQTLNQTELKELERRFFVHPLYLNELQFHRRLLAILTCVAFEGVKDYYLYLKLGFQFFNLHIEQMLFTFIHHQLEGESLWFIIPFNQLSKLYDLAGEMYRVLYGIKKNITQDHCQIMGRALLYSKQLFPPLSLLKKYGIEYREVRLKSGEVLIAHGGYAHFGYSTHPGATVSVAINMVTDAWLKDGLPFLKDYFEWVGQVKPLVKMHEVAWSEWLLTPAGLASRSIHQLKSPKEFVAKALNLCPLNFACSFMRGLYADLGALSDKKAVCEYPSLECLDHDRLTEEVKKMQSQCSHIVQLIHEQRDWIKEQTNEKECTGCTNDQPHDPHSCMLCLCRSDPRINEMLSHNDTIDDNTSVAY